MCWSHTMLCHEAHVSRRDQPCFKHILIDDIHNHGLDHLSCDHNMTMIVSWRILRDCQGFGWSHDCWQYWHTCHNDWLTYIRLYEVPCRRKGWPCKLGRFQYNTQITWCLASALILNIWEQHNYRAKSTCPSMCCTQLQAETQGESSRSAEACEWGDFEAVAA